MKVRTVSFSRTKNIGNFQSRKLEVEIEVGNEDSPSEVVRKAQVFVESQLEYMEVDQEARSRIGRLEFDLEVLE